MTAYRFFSTADDAQDDIWDYTCKEWSETQAEKYIRGLHKHIQQLADKQKPWHPLPNILITPAFFEAEVYFSHYEKHYIFFRELSDGALGVMSILHEKMDLPVRLVEDLNKLK